MDLENLVNEVVLFVVRRDKKEIFMEEMEEVIIRVIVGLEKKSRVIIEYDKKLIVYYEVGYVVVMKLFLNCDLVYEISIIFRGRVGGYIMYFFKEDIFYIFKFKLKDEMVGFLGGRVVEKLIMGDISIGVKNDIDRVSYIVKSMVMDYGMSDEIGIIFYNIIGYDEVFFGRDLGKLRDFSEEVGVKIDKEIKRFIDEVYDIVNKLLKSNINKLYVVV